MAGAYVNYTRDYGRDTLMPAKKIYNETPLQVLTDKGTRDRVRRLSMVSGQSQAAVVRSILEFGLPVAEDIWDCKDVEVPDEA
jgi:hypothetical protein